MGPNHEALLPISCSLLGEAANSTFGVSTASVSAAAAAKIAISAAA